MNVMICVQKIKTRNQLLHYRVRLISHVLGCKHSGNQIKPLNLFARERSEEYKKN